MGLWNASGNSLLKTAMHTSAEADVVTAGFSGYDALLPTPGDDRRRYETVARMVRGGEDTEMNCLFSGLSEFASSIVRAIEPGV